MKKYVKIVFSRFTLVALTILALVLVDFVIVFGPFIFLRDFFAAQFSEWEWLISGVFNVARWIILIVTVLNIVNRDMIPEAKIPWLLCVVALNIFGVFIYAVFSQNRPTKRQRKMLQELYEHSGKYCRPSPEGLERDFEGLSGVSKELQTENPRAVVYTNTQTEYFANGESFFERLMEDLKNAKEYIFLEFFIIEYGVMWQSVLDVLKQKVKEGVEARVIYDDIGCMGKIHSGYYKRLRKEGISCVKFNPFVPVVTNLHNNRDHRKIVVIDKKIGYTGGINLSDEYINVKQPFRQWKDSAVRLEGEGVRTLTLMFLQTYNLLSRNRQEDFSRYLAEDCEKTQGEGYVQPYGDGPKPLYSTHLAENVYINILNNAKKYVWIMSPYLIIDYRMKNAMLSAAARGVDVRIIAPHIPDKKTAFALTRSNYMALIRGGVKIYEYTPGFIHSKSFLCDDEVGVVGTINLDYRSLLHHYEDAVLMYGTKANKQMKADYEETFEICALQTEEDAKRNVVWRVICEILKVFAPLF